jgi:RNA polymerase sigma-70 factor, ECF subfamily
MSQPDRRGTAKASDAAVISRAIAGAKENDMDALRFLYVRFADDVCQYVQSIVRDRHAAEQVTQTVFAGLLAEMRAYDRRQFPFRAWLLRLAHDAGVSHLRSRHVVPFEEARGRQAQSDEPDEHSRSLRVALERLSPDQREVLMLGEVAGLTPPQIARRLNKPERAIRALHRRGRGTLNATLRELEAAPVKPGANAG